MSAFVLKIIALIAMTFDHTSYLVFGGLSFMNYIGRIAFPIFAFQISEGYMHTKDIKKYLFRLLIFAFISQAPFMLFTSMYTNNVHLNIFFTLFLGLISIIIFDGLKEINVESKFLHYILMLLGLLCTAGIAGLSQYIHCDYGYFGVLIIFIFYLFKNKVPLMNIAFTICTFIYYYKNIFYSRYTNTYILLFICTCLSLIFINIYNHKKGKNIKYLLYIYYPLHLLILYGLSFII